MNGLGLLWEAEGQGHLLWSAPNTIRKYILTIISTTAASWSKSTPVSRLADALPTRKIILRSAPLTLYAPLTTRASSVPRWGKP